LPTFLSATSRPQSSSGLSSEKTFFICPTCVALEPFVPNLLFLPGPLHFHRLNEFSANGAAY
jgi:hypothetical protein